MDNSKKESISAGKNVELEGVTVINEGVSLNDDKKEASINLASEEATPVVAEAPKEEVAPIIPEIPSVEASANDVPTVPVIPTVPTSTVSEIDIPAYDPSASFNSVEQSMVPQPIEFPTNVDNFSQTSDVNGLEQPQFGNFNEFDPSNNFNVIQGEFGNSIEEQDKVPAGVETSLGMVKNEVLELVRDNKKLSEENANLRSVNEELRSQNAECQNQIRLLKQDKRDLESSMAKAQHQILNVFGMSGMNASQPNVFMTDDNVKDRNMAA